MDVLSRTLACASIVAVLVAAPPMSWAEHLVPIGVQAGKIIRVARQPVSVAAELAYAVAHPASAPYDRWQGAVEYVLLFPHRP